MEYTYEGLVRYSFGFSNPNHAAALIAMLIPVSWGLRRICRNRILYASVLAVEILLYLALIATMSRTGMLAVATGGVLFHYLIYKGCGWRRTKSVLYFSSGVRKSLIRIAIIASIVFVALLASGTLGRHCAWLGSPDDSILNRLNLWQGGLRILSDNPSGVGTGLSGAVFTDFCQSAGSGLSFRTMVNSFLTFMVEQGVLLSFLVAVPLFFAFAASFISLLREDMPDKRKHLIISLMTSCFCAFISGMSSTCFDLSVVAGFFSHGPVDLNSIMQMLLSVIAIGLVAALIWIPLKYLRPVQVKLALLVAISASAAVVSGAILSGSLLTSLDGRTCTVSERNGLKVATIGTAKGCGRILVLPDTDRTDRKTVADFARNRYGGYSVDFPLFAVNKPFFAFFENYDIVMLCGGNAVLAKSAARKYILYRPVAFVGMNFGKLEKVYLGRYDEYGCNTRWEQACFGLKQKIRYFD